MDNSVARVMQTMPEQQAESSFPIAWDRFPGEFQSARNGCPIVEEQIAGYLRHGHYRFFLEEAPTEFFSGELLDIFVFPDRRIWVWSWKDGLDRDWIVLVGCGKSPFAGEACERTWMLGKTNFTGRSPKDVLVKEFPEYADMVGKAI